MSELRKIKNPFSLLRQRVANFQISIIWAIPLHWNIQNKFYLSKKGIARQYYISLEKENYDDIGTPLEFRQENDFRITTFVQCQCQVGKPMLKTQRCDNVSFCNVVTTLWQRCLTSRAKYSQNSTLLQRRVPAK